MFKKLHLNSPDNMAPTYNSTAPTFNNSTPNSRLVPGPPQLGASTSTGYHAVSGDYQNQYKEKNQSYRESDASVYSTYDLRESLVDPSNERVVGISRETYIEPQTSTLVHTQVTPQSIYGAQSLNPQDASRASFASLKPSMAHMSFFNDESSDSLHSDIRNLRPPSPVKSRYQQAESPVRMQHAYVDVPLPSAAVIEQVSADNTASVYIDRSSNVSGYFSNAAPATAAPRSAAPEFLSTSYSNNNNVDSYYNNATSSYATQQQQQPLSSSSSSSSSSHTSRQHPQPLAPLVIPPTPSRSTTQTQQQQQYQQASSPQHHYQQQPSPMQQSAPAAATYYQPQLYSNTSRSQEDGLQQPQLTPGTQGGSSPYTVSPRTPSPNTLLPPQQPYANNSLSPSSLSSSPTSPLQQPPLSPCVPPPSAHPGLSKKLQKQMQPSQESDDPPQSEAEALVAEGIRYHEASNLDKATECFRRAANKDSPIGMFLYGVSLRHGWGCKRNESTAFQYLQKAAEHAVMDLNSLSSTVSTSAAKGELIMAIYELGVSYIQGWGCRKNKETAVYFFKLAADLGDPDAQNDLARCYYTGKGVKKDMKLAAKYYRMADKQGCGIMGNSWIYKSKYD